nr:phosphate acyltransferase PlsX [Nannocystis pusilla]
MLQQPHAVAHIVLDSCAGRDGGREALEAAAIASLQLDHQITVVGDESAITDALAKIAHDAERLRVAHARDRCEPDQDAADVLRQAPRNSIVVGLEIAARDPSAVFVSAGAPGTIVAGAQQILNRIPGVPHAALAAVYPTLRPHGPVSDLFALLLDVGATVECSGDDLVTFAAMGAAYASKISRIDRPRVALLCNGHGIANAPVRAREAHRRLLAAKPAFEYVGCIRADSVTSGDADVIVTDGFSGDVLLRTLEGVAATGESLLRRAAEKFQWRVGVQMLSDGISAIREFTDWENYGGAPLLGFGRAVVVTQADSGRRAFLNAIRLGAKIDRLQVIAAVSEGVAAFHGLSGPPRAPAPDPEAT